MTAETIIQSLASGLLMGLLYRLDRRGAGADLRPDGRRELRPWRVPDDRDVRDLLPVRLLRVDPLLAAPLVAAALFVFGAVVYLLVVRFAVRAKANAGMCRSSRPSGLPSSCAGWRSSSSPRLPQHYPFLARRKDDLDRRRLPAGAATGRRAGVDRGLCRAVLLHQPTPISAARWRPPARTPARWRWSVSTRTGCSRWAGASVRRWWAWPARSWRCLLRLSRCRRLLCADRVCHGGIVRLRQRVRAEFAGGIIVGLVEASTALILPPSLKIGRQSTRSICWWCSSGRAACSGRSDGQGFRPAPSPRPGRRRPCSPFSPPWCRYSSRTSTSRTSWC